VNKRTTRIIINTCCMNAIDRSLDRVFVLQTGVSRCATVAIIAVDVRTTFLDGFFARFAAVRSVLRGGSTVSPARRTAPVSH